MKKEEKIIIIAFLCCCILGLACGVIVKVDKDHLKKIELSNISTTYSPGYTVCIDSAEYSNDRLVIKGWVAERANFNPDFQCLIKDEQGNFYSITTRSVKRSEVTQYFNDGNNYDDAGFVATGKIKVGKLKGTCTIHMLVKDKNQNRYLIQTDRTINLE